MKLIITALATILSIGSCMTAYGGTWRQDASGWWYQNDDGTWPANGWFTDIDGKSYYFNESGYMLSNTTTPDGKKVGADGALIQAVTGVSSNKGDLYYSGLRGVLDSIPLYPQENTGHTWCQLDYNGVTYIFDPQVEDVIANGRGGAIMYIRFGGTTAQLADKYRYTGIKDDFSRSYQDQESEFPYDTGEKYFNDGTGWKTASGEAVDLDIEKMLNSLFD